MQQIENVKLRVKVAGASGRIFKEIEQFVTVDGNKANIHADIVVETEDIADEIFFLDLELLDDQQFRLADNRYLFTKTDSLAPMLNYSTTSLKVSREEDEYSWLITIENTGKAAALLLKVEDILDLETDSYPYYSDNYFTLLPDEKKTIRVNWSSTIEEKRKLLIKGWNIDKIEI